MIQMLHYFNGPRLWGLLYIPELLWIMQGIYHQPHKTLTRHFAVNNDSVLTLALGQIQAIMLSSLKNGEDLSIENSRANQQQQQ